MRKRSGLPRAADVRDAYQFVAEAARICVWFSLLSANSGQFAIRSDSDAGEWFAYKLRSKNRKLQRKVARAGVWCSYQRFDCFCYFTRKVAL